MDPYLGPSPTRGPHLEPLAEPKPLWLSSGRFFSIRIHTANKETNAEAETAGALFNGQRMEKWELSSQINFSSGVELF